MRDIDTDILKTRGCISRKMKQLVALMVIYDRTASLGHVFTSFGDDGPDK